MSDTYALSETDFNSIANKIAAKAKDVKPDAIILCSNPVAVNPLTKALRALGVKVPIYNQGSGAHPLPMFAGAGNDPAVVAGDYAIGPAIVDPSRCRHLSGEAGPDRLRCPLESRRGREEPFASLFLGFAYDTIHLAEQAIKTATDQTSAGYAAAMEKVDWWGAQATMCSPRPTTSAATVASSSAVHQRQGFKLIRDLNAMPAQ